MAKPPKKKRYRWLIAFLFRWFGYRWGYNARPTSPPEMRRYGTATPPGNPSETPNPRLTPSRPPTSPGRLPAPLRPCRLAMHRHHRYARAIATSYGEVRVQIPVFRCGQCRLMAGGMTLPGEEMRHQRFSKKTVTSPSAWLRLIELRQRRELGGLRQEYRLPVAAEGAFDSAGIAAGRNPGTGRYVDANPQRPY